MLLEVWRAPLLRTVQLLRDFLLLPEVWRALKRSAKLLKGFLVAPEALLALACVVALTERLEESSGVATAWGTTGLWATEPTMFREPD